MSVVAESERARQIPFRFAAFPKVPFAWIGPATSISDVVLTIASGIAAGLFTGGRDIEASFAVGLMVTFNLVVLNGYRRNYASDAIANVFRQIREVTVLWCVIFLFLASIALLLKTNVDFPPRTAFIFFVLGWALLVSSRTFIAGSLLIAREGGAFAEKKIVVIGDPQLLATSNCIAGLEHYGYSAARVIDFSCAQTGSEVVGEVDKVMRCCREIDSIVIVVGWDQAERIDSLVEELRILHLPIRLMPDPKVAHFLDKRGIQLGTTWTKELWSRPLNVAERAVKRAIDLMLSICIGILILPLMLIVALIIKLDSAGPVLFTQTRHGFNNRTFRIFKFRTLHTVEDGPIIKQVERNDSRVTRVGRVLRRTSIDELPQLWNVIRGEMSLVGPRPHPAAFDSKYGDLIANYAFRHHVKPGLTGWAQVNGFRGETSTIDLMKRRVELDLWYIDNWKLSIDIKILAKTLGVVLGQPSAY
jgi:Undecaprenyl-phosphate glucose phosphotransferase